MIQLSTIVRNLSLNVKSSFLPSYQRLMSTTPLTTNKELNTFINTHPKSILYFTATWCTPCKSVSAFYSKLSDFYKDLNFGKVDVDDNKESSMEYNIGSV